MWRSQLWVSGARPVWMLVRVVRSLWARPVGELVGISWSLPWWPIAAIGAIMAAGPMPKASGRVALEWADRTSSRETGGSSSLVFISRKSVSTEARVTPGGVVAGSAGVLAGPLVLDNSVE